MFRRIPMFSILCKLRSNLLVRRARSSSSLSSSSSSSRSHRSPGRRGGMHLSTPHRKMRRRSRRWRRTSTTSTTTTPRRTRSRRMRLATTPRGRRNRTRTRLCRRRLSLRRGHQLRLRHILPRPRIILPLRTRSPRSREKRRPDRHHLLPLRLRLRPRVPTLLRRPLARASYFRLPSLSGLWDEGRKFTGNGARAGGGCM